MLEIYICVGSSCHLKGSYPVIKRFQELVEQYGLQEQVEIKASFCLEHCTRGVSVKVGEEFVEDLTPSNVEERFREYVLERHPHERHSI